MKNFWCLEGFGSKHVVVRRTYQASQHGVLPLTCLSVRLSVFSPFSCVILHSKQKYDNKNQMSFLNQVIVKPNSSFTFSVNISVSLLRISVLNKYTHNLTHCQNVVLLICKVSFERRVLFFLLLSANEKNLFFFLLFLFEARRGGQQVLLLSFMSKHIEAPLSFQRIELATFLRHCLLAETKPINTQTKKRRNQSKGETANKS